LLKCYQRINYGLNFGPPIPFLTHTSRIKGKGWLRK